MTARELLESISVIVAVDGKLADEEKKYLYQVAKEFRVSKEELADIFDHVRSGSGRIATPKSQDDQVELYTHLLKAASADGDISEEEAKILQKVGDRIGINNSSVPALMSGVELNGKEDCLGDTTLQASDNPGDDVPEQSALWKSVVWPCVALVLIVLFWFLTINRGTPIPTELPTSPKITLEEQQAERKIFYDAKVVPLLASMQDANSQAMDRCVERIEHSFSQYKDGINPFVESLTSWGTRWQVLKRMPLDWWREEKKVDEYVKTIFEENVLREGQLEDDITASLEVLREDIEANNREFLAKAKTAASTSNLPYIVLPDYSKYEEAVQSQLQQFVVGRGTDSVRNLIVTMVAGEAAGIVATQIVVTLLSRVGVSTALTAGVGATAAATGTGALGGSALGPVGTAVGFGVGLAVGVVVDWWMTEEFSENMTADMNTYLENLEKSIIDGVDGQEGLRAGLNGVLEDMRQAQSVKMQECLLGDVQ